MGFTRTLNIRLKEADTVVFLDLPKYVTILRLLKAGIKGVRNGRVGQPEFLKTKISRSLFKKVISFSKKKTLAKLNEYSDRKVVILRTEGQIQDFLQALR